MLAGNLSTMMDLVREGESNFDVVQAVGQSCDYPNNLLSGAHLIAQVCLFKYFSLYSVYIQSIFSLYSV